MLKNILFLLSVAIALQACGGKELEFEVDPDSNFEADLDSICQNQSFNPDTFKVKSTHYGTQLEQVEVQLATLREEYSSDDACIPFSVVATNKGADPIYLTDEQLVQLNSNGIGLYVRGVRPFLQSLESVDDNAVLHGEPWQPGVRLEFAAFIRSERIKLYAPSYSAEPIKVLNASFKGPSPLLGVTSVNALISIDEANFNAKEMVVRFNDGVDLSQAEAIIAASGSAIKGAISFDFLPMMLVMIPADKSIDQMINYFELDPLVKSADRNDTVIMSQY